MPDRLSLPEVAQRIVDSPLFRGVVVGTILSASVLVGLETSQDLMDSFAPLLRALDKLVLGVFVAEIALKLAANGSRPWRFFRDGWNVFDFCVVVVCLVPIQAQYLSVLRLARILRVLRLVSVLPRLQILVGALLKSLPSIGYVGLLLGIHFYVYAVLGRFLWGENDPVRFGSLPLAFLTLFQCVTMEGWVEIMHIQMYGCAAPILGDAPSWCVSSRGMPLVAPLYFITFIVLGTMIILNLFIGVMMSSLEEMKQERDISRRPGASDSVLLDEVERIHEDVNSALRRLSDLKRCLQSRP